MATTEEIERRVEENDSPVTAKRIAAAKRVSELARLRGETAEKLADIERELGDVLAESSNVVSVHELAAFTDVPAADLDPLLGNRKTARPKRKRPAAATAVKGETIRKPSTTTPSSADKAPVPPGVEVPPRPRGPLHAHSGTTDRTPPSPLDRSTSTEPASAGP